MSGLDARLAAFVEYVCRPMVEDIRLILDQCKSLNVTVTPKVAKDIIVWLGIWHLAVEGMRMLTYVLVTGLIVEGVVRVWPLL